MHVGLFGTYLKENTTLHHYKYQVVNAVKEIITVYSEKRTRPINTKYSITDSQSIWFI
jgi:hypothetical protein